MFLVCCKYEKRIFFFFFCCMLLDEVLFIGDMHICLNPVFVFEFSHCICLILCPVCVHRCFCELLWELTCFMTNMGFDLKGNMLWAIFKYKIKGYQRHSDILFLFKYQHDVSFYCSESFAQISSSLIFKSLKGCLLSSHAGTFWRCMLLNVYIVSVLNKLYWDTTFELFFFFTPYSSCGYEGLHGYGPGYKVTFDYNFSLNSYW